MKCASTTLSGSVHGCGERNSGHAGTSIGASEACGRTRSSSISIIVSTNIGQLHDRLQDPAGFEPAVVQSMRKNGRDINCITRIHKIISSTYMHYSGPLLYIQDMIPLMRMQWKIAPGSHSYHINSNFFSKIRCRKNAYPSLYTCESSVILVIQVQPSAS